MASYLRAPSIERLPILLEELHSGSLCVPPFQREFEWTGDQRLTLFNSIWRGLPTGSLMVWRTSRKLPSQDPLGPYKIERSEPRPAPTQYLLDGRQRMTTLYAALAASFWSRAGRDVPITERNAPDQTPWAVLFGLEDQDFSFDEPLPPTSQPSMLSSIAIPAQPRLPLGVLFDDAAFDEWREQARLSREYVNRARALRSAFFDYLIPVVPLATEDIEVVTTTFKRVNSGGTPMGDADMARALSWSEEYDLGDEIDDVQQILRPQGWGEIERETVLATIAGIASKDSTSIDVEELATRLKEQPELVKTAGKVVSRAAQVLDERLGVRGPRALPNIQILVFAARAIHLAGGDLNSDQEQILAAWAAEASIDERFRVTVAHMLRAYYRALVTRLGLHADKASSPPAIRRRSAGECWKFRMIWARSRATALVLAAQKPTDGSGTLLDDPHQLIASSNENNIGMLLVRGQPELRGHSLGMALQSPANRFVCPPDRLLDLRRLLLDGDDCPQSVLDGHLVTADAHRALRRRDFLSFFEARRASIRAAEERWVRDRGGEVTIVPEPRTYAQG